MLCVSVHGIRPVIGVINVICGFDEGDCLVRVCSFLKMLCLDCLNSDIFILQLKEEIYACIRSEIVFSLARTFTNIPSNVFSVLLVTKLVM